MTTHEQEFGKKITTYLDAANRELKSGTLYRLQQARGAALARVSDARRAPELALAGAGGSMAGPRPFYSQVRFWIGVALIAFAALGWQQWQAYQSAWQAAKDAEEVDAQLLTSDLPIDAYLDRGFQVWLRSTSSQD
jgi:hypothetical protein